MVKRGHEPNDNREMLDIRFLVFNPPVFDELQLSNEQATAGGTGSCGMMRQTNNDKRQTNNDKRQRCTAVPLYRCTLLYLMSSSASPSKARLSSFPPRDSLVVVVTVMWMVKMAWEREDTSFIAVAAVALPRSRGGVGKAVDADVSR